MIDTEVHLVEVDGGKYKCLLGSTHKVQVNPGWSLFDWAMKPFALRRLGHHIV